MFLALEFRAGSTRSFSHLLHIKHEPFDPVVCRFFPVSFVMIVEVAMSRQQGRSRKGGSHALYVVNLWNCKAKGSDALKGEVVEDAVSCCHGEGGDLARPM